MKRGRTPFDNTFLKMVHMIRQFLKVLIACSCKGFIESVEIIKYHDKDRGVL
ncbi:hypothetical protein GCM10011391_06870 [Pullulanibacillus camelliae]|uniref:Uncharacterized protein n=1 Tax=Pullulanibacillus camelliae TaxID=1707096 RepID=A0A8J2VLI0_9BACL|nr:hypothetical protein GCM10011391_06870 [Pullulanibacillus camelliae]